MKYYFDTSIWRDYFENRSEKFMPTGDWAFELLQKIIKERSIVLYSDLVIKELRIDYSDEEIERTFDIIKSVGLLNKVDVTQEDYSEVRKLKSTLDIPFSDIIHAVLAKNNNALLVYRDKHFYELQKITEIKKPEELI